MLNEPVPEQLDETTVESVVAGGPRGAIWLAGTSTAIVVALWFAFYLLVFLPRGPAQ